MMPNNRHSENYTTMWVLIKAPSCATFMLTSFTFLSRTEYDFLSFCQMNTNASNVNKNSGIHHSSTWQPYTKEMNSMHYIPRKLRVALFA